MNKSNPKIDIVILAAGLGTRMKSSKPKVLHELMGKPMVAYILDAVKDLCEDPAVIIVGNQAELVKKTLGDQARYALQEPQLGTADAVKCAREMLQGKSEVVLVANSDFPLIKPETYRALVEKTSQQRRGLDCFHRGNSGPAWFWPHCARCGGESSRDRGRKSGFS